MTDLYYKRFKFILNLYEMFCFWSERSHIEDQKEKSFFFNLVNYSSNILDIIKSDAHCQRERNYWKKKVNQTWIDLTSAKGCLQFNWCIGSVSNFLLTWYINLFKAFLRKIDNQFRFSKILKEYFSRAIVLKWKIKRYRK